MAFTPYKISCTIIAVIVVPCFGRIALNGSGVEHEIERYILPLIVGATSGLLIGLLLDKWHTSIKILEKTTRRMKTTGKLSNTSTSWHSALFEKSHSVILILDPKTGKIIDANPQASLFYGYPKEKLKHMSAHDINIQNKKEVLKVLHEAKQETRKLFYLKHRLANGEIKDVEVFSGAIDIDGTPFLLSVIQDITELNRLRGILSICSHCKKIRNKKGGWTDVEAFIENNTAADFSHGLCPTCVDQLYPNHSIDLK